MNTQGSSVIAAIAGLLICQIIGPAGAQTPSAERIIIAQSSDYLPPPDNRAAPPPAQADGYNNPQSITPRRREALPPASPPPSQGQQSYQGESYRGQSYQGQPSGQSSYQAPPPYQGPPPYGGAQGDNDPDYEREAGAPRDLPRRPYRDAGAPPPAYQDNTYSDDEIIDAGHRFFGSVSKGLAKVVEYTFSKQGRPNGYILGEEAGGAIVAGLRYGNGQLYTKGLGTHRIYWQGPSLGYDFGAEGSKTLILVYNLSDAGQIYNRFAGVDGSAYLVGGVGVTFQTFDDVVLAPIRSGVGLRLGANVGYLKYTKSPTWNPF